MLQREQTNIFETLEGGKRTRIQKWQPTLRPSLTISLLIQQQRLY